MGRYADKDAIAEALRGPKVADAGITICCGSSWGAHERGHITLPHQGDTLTFPIAYDEREAPYVTDGTGAERKGLLISLTDEEGLIGCAWAHTKVGSTLCGIGIDLASPTDFGVRPNTERLLSLMFSERERTLAKELYPDDAPLSFATLFAAKEAAFKACARPLRDWYARGGHELAFEVRDFGMDPLGTEHGRLRRGAAQAALNELGIRRIICHHTTERSLALVVALAYRDS